MRFNTQAISSNILTPHVWYISQETMSGLCTASFYFSGETTAVSGVTARNTAHCPADRERRLLRHPSLVLQGKISHLLYSSREAKLPLLFRGEVKFLHSPISSCGFTIVLWWSFLPQTCVPFSLPWSKHDLRMSVMTQISKTRKLSLHSPISLFTKGTYIIFYVNIRGFDYLSFEMLYVKMWCNDFLITMWSSF